MKHVAPTTTDEEYHQALAEIETYFNHLPDPGTVEADRFDLLTTLIMDYESKHWPIDEISTA